MENFFDFKLETFLWQLCIRDHTTLIQSTREYIGNTILLYRVKSSLNVIQFYTAECAPRWRLVLHYYFPGKAKVGGGCSCHASRFRCSTCVLFRHLRTWTRTHTRLPNIKAVRLRAIQLSQCRSPFSLLIGLRIHVIYVKCISRAVICRA